MPSAASTPLLSWLKLTSTSSLSAATLQLAAALTSR